MTNGQVFPIDPAKASVYAINPPFPMGGSGLVSSPRDYDRFLRMLAGSGMSGSRRVMSQEAVRIGTSNLLPPGNVTKGTMLEGYGFGAGGRMGGPDGRNEFGWAGAAGTVGFVDLASGLRTALYTQYMPSDAYPVNGEFEKAVLADLAKSRKGN